MGGVRYFPSLHGRIQPIEIKGDGVEVLPDWPLVSAADAAGHWRPSGWQLIASDDQKLLYVLMQADAHEGTHKDPANEVWVYNPATKARVKRLRLVRPGLLDCTDSRGGAAAAGAGGRTAGRLRCT